MESPESETLPQVVLLRHPHHFLELNRPLPTDLHFLKPWESPLPLQQFLSTHAQSAQALLTTGTTPVNAEIIRLLPNLRLVVTTSAGVNHIDLAECRQRGIAITNAGVAYSEVVAELAVGLLIDVCRKLSTADRYVRQGRWLRDGDFPLGSKLRGKRVGIVGLGRIGSEVAKRLEAFGCILLYSSRKPKPFANYPFYSNVRDLALHSDALIVCCELNQETQHMIDKEVMMALGKEGVIVNIGRGPIIDEKEMVERLVGGELGGAGLDVFEDEPSVPNEMLGLDNVVLSDVCELTVANLRAFFANKALLSPVLLE